MNDAPPTSFSHHTMPSAQMSIASSVVGPTASMMTSSTMPSSMTASSVGTLRRLHQPRRVREDNQRAMEMSWNALALNRMLSESTAEGDCEVRHQHQPMP